MHSADQKPRVMAIEHTEMRAQILAAPRQTGGEQKCGRAPPGAMGRELQEWAEELLRQELQPIRSLTGSAVLMSVRLSPTMARARRYRSHLHVDRQITHRCISAVEAPSISFRSVCSTTLPSITGRLTDKDFNELQDNDVVRDFCVQIAERCHLGACCRCYAVI